MRAIVPKHRWPGKRNARPCSFSNFQKCGQPGDVLPAIDHRDAAWFERAVDFPGAVESRGGGEVDAHVCEGEVEDIVIER